MWGTGLQWTHTMKFLGSRCFNSAVFEAHRHKAWSHCRKASSTHTSNSHEDHLAEVQKRLGTPLKKSPMVDPMQSYWIILSLPRCLCSVLDCINIGMPFLLLTHCWFFLLLRNTRACQGLVRVGRFLDVNCGILVHLIWVNEPIRWSSSKCWSYACSAVGPHCARSSCCGVWAKWSRQGFSYSRAAKKETGPAFCCNSNYQVGRDFHKLDSASHHSLDLSYVA